MSKVLEILIKIDEKANHLTGGHKDLTISARIGYQARSSPLWSRMYWVLLEWMVNTAFEPVDGPDHCYKAFIADPDKDKVRHGPKWRLVVLGAGTLIVSAFIAVLLRIAVKINPDWAYKSKS